MKRVKKRRFSGAVCEQIVFNVRETTDTKTAKPRRPRFQTEEEREEFNNEISRKKFVHMVNGTFTTAGYYSTLTFSTEYEIHTAEDARRERKNFYRRIMRKYPEAKVVIVYGRGKATSRFHLHMISEGVPIEEIGKIWGRGSVIETKQLRAHNYYVDQKTGELVDHGADWTALASYMHAHWRKEFGGHRWLASSNVREPEAEAPTEAIREYDEKHPPVAPKGFVLVETKATKYGYIYYKYVRIPEKEKKRQKGRNVLAL